MTATQAGDLHERFTRSRKHSKQVALLGTRLPDNLRPFTATGPSYRSAGSREVQLRRGLETMLPFFSGDFESSIFKTRQCSYDVVVEFELAVVTIFVGSQRGHDTGELFRLERVE